MLKKRESTTSEQNDGINESFSVKCPEPLHLKPDFILGRLKES